MQKSAHTSSPAQTVSPDAFKSRWLRAAVRGVAATLFVGAVSAVSAQTFLWNTYNESTFTDGYSTGSSVTVSVPANSRMTVFTSSFTPLSLGLNTTTAFSFSFSATGALTSAGSTNNRVLYAGLFNSGATTTGATRFQDDTGYLVRWNPGSAGNGFLEYQERAAGVVNSLYNGYTGTSFGVGSNSAAIELLDNTTYSVTERLVRAANGNFSFGTNNTSTTYGVALAGLPATYYGYTNTDSTPVTSFDSFAFMIQNTTGSAISYTLSIDSGLSGTYSAIPEPSTYAAIAGAAVLGLAVWRRRVQAKAPVTNA